MCTGNCRCFLLLLGLATLVCRQATGTNDGTTVGASGYYEPPYDADYDGLDDAWEQRYFGGLDSGPEDDVDDDGEDNLAELRSATHPYDASSVMRSSRQQNISTRLRVLTGENVLIGGFIISGSQPKRVIIRALGPSLASGGVDGALADPMIALFDAAGGNIASNNNWKESQQSEIQATTIPPVHDSEAAIVQTLAPGGYTASVAGAGGSTGIALVEVYDLSATQPGKLANISTRGFVATGRQRDDRRIHHRRWPRHQRQLVVHDCCSARLGPAFPAPAWLALCKTRPWNW